MGSSPRLRHPWALVLALGLVGFLCTCGRAPSLGLSPEERAWLQAHPVLRWAPDPGAPPLEWVDSQGVAQGLGPEYLRALEGPLGVHFEAVPVSSWTEALEALRSERVDLLSTLTPTEDRRAWMHFSKPHLDIPSILLVRTASPEQSLEDCDGRRIAIQRGLLAVRLLRESHPRIVFVEFDQSDTCIQQVALGTVDGAVTDLSQASWAIEQQGLSGLRMAARIPSLPSQYAIGIRKGAPELAGILTKALASLSEAERQGLQRRWINLKVQAWRPTKRFWLILGSGLLILATALVLIWNRILAAQVRHRTEKLQQALAERDRIEGEKEILLAMITHELRTPLTSVKGALDLLKPGLREEAAQNLHRIGQANLERVLNLVDDLLDVDKLARSGVELHLGPIDARDLVARTVEACRPYAHLLGVEVRFEAPDVHLVPARGDAKRLGQVLTNLISNAAKHSPEGEVVRVRLHQREDGVRVEVEDHGPGIPEYLRPRIFEPFSQGELETRGPKGTGLGLAICRSLVELHEGRIGFETETGKGTTFWFEW